MIINFSPQHPSTHGVLRLIIILHGEIIEWIHPEIGLLHRGTEKLIDCNSYLNTLPFFDRLDYVTTITQELLFIQVLERIISVYNSSFVSMVRTLLLEIYRNLNHSLNITTHAIDIGMFTTMLWIFEEREKLINFIEGLTGTRFHALFLLVGRLRYEIHLYFIDSLFYWLIHYIRKVREIHYILTCSRLWKTRLYEIGIIKKDLCLFFGLTGIIARSSNIFIDGRFFIYEFYHSIDWSVFLASNGDSLDRYLLRMNEINQSNKLVFIIGYHWLVVTINHWLSLITIDHW